LEAPHSNFSVKKFEKKDMRKKAAEGFAIFSSCQKGVLILLIKM
jgi:hypothetical protein